MECQELTFRELPSGSGSGAGDALDGFADVPSYVSHSRTELCKIPRLSNSLKLLQSMPKRDGEPMTGQTQHSM